jgi:hypothetical protein
MSDNSRTAVPKDLVQSTEAMLDYAIIAGAELKNPAFVRLLRAARRALLGQSPARPRPDNGAPEPGTER